ncbi:XRE family transcriptional regulator [Clostridiaceae bacterium 14S0207]|nr:XRE family transcriptional regulator [Clostridiaceae bacterium 14S0207]
MTIGDNMRRIAEEKNMTIYQVMKKSKVSMGYIYDLANNKQNNPSITILLKIAKALDVSIEELIN